MRRLSIRILMAVVLVSAFGLAALRNANELWATVMTMVALAFVCVAVLWAVLLRGRERAWWSGFALLGGVYLLISGHGSHLVPRETRVGAGCCRIRVGRAPYTL